MLDKVKAWTPPSFEHIGLRDFMIQQIKDSIKWDCDLGYHERLLTEMSVITFEEWKKTALDDARRHVCYYTDELAKATTREAGRVVWLQQLIDSLK
jgi:hypothetical protein